MAKAKAKRAPRPRQADPDEIVAARPQLVDYAPEREADPDATPPELTRGGEAARASDEGG
jgi:hypothetical protein